MTKGWISSLTNRWTLRFQKIWSTAAQKMWKKAGPPHHPVVHGELSSGPQQISHWKTICGGTSCGQWRREWRRRWDKAEKTKKSPMAAQISTIWNGKWWEASWVFSLSTGHGGPQHKTSPRQHQLGQKRIIKVKKKTWEICHGHHHSRTTTTTAQHSGGPCSSTSWNLGSKVWR